MNSSRLPGKFLREINGKAIAKYIVERLLTHFSKQQIIIATSKEESDQAIADFCKAESIRIYRGELENVASRVLEAASFYELDYVVRICGDNLFLDASIVSKMLDMTVKNDWDFCSNTKGRTFPTGMSVEVLNTKHLFKAYQKFENPVDFEHVTPYFYRNQKVGKTHYIYNEICPSAKGLHMAIDDEQDFERAKKKSFH